MIKGKKVLAIIPARGGSKRLPGKNILPIAGKPMIYWTIEAAKKSKYIDRIVVSSDDVDILSHSISSGIEGLRRPKELATDGASSIAVVEHVVKTLDELFHYMILLQPTSPLRNAEHVNQACELLVKLDADAVVSVNEVDHSPLWSNTLPDNQSMDNFLPSSIKNLRSQDLPLYYRLNGAIYLGDISKVLKEKSFILKEKTFAYCMNRKHSFDIDDGLDFFICESILKGEMACTLSK